eukprot:TRINITY_DN103009_c0_g1_i1.p1 TRINITY_DN103009_c0_g1~~TRINITY_DN103009_c0_g1_i1.p1  ORF type:complete len:203 (-),score=45.45 TRINITY_DN103009_c0_g1_i1:647-1255(-)
MATPPLQLHCTGKALARVASLRDCFYCCGRFVVSWPRFCGLLLPVGFVVAFLPAMYSRMEAADLREMLDAKESRLQLMSSLAAQKEDQLQELRVLLKHAEDLAAERLMSSTQERHRVDRCIREMESVSQAKSSCESQRRQCELDNEDLSNNLQAAAADHEALTNESHELHARMQELEVFVEDARSCCESTPMCNLCLIRKSR